MSAIPIALSVLSTLASHYTAQKAFPTPPTVPTQSAPINIPNTAPQNSVNPPVSHSGSSGSNTLCEVCHVNPKYFDGVKTHRFCGKTCAANATNGNATTVSGSSSGASGNCDYCHNRPKYRDGTRTHAFCSKVCAKSANSGSQAQRQNTVKNTKNTCRIQGCSKTPHGNANGTPGEYCSMAHKALAETLCLICRKAAKQTKSHFCGKACSDEAEKKGPFIVEVPTGHVTFKSVAEQFKASWRHVGTVPPPVKRVYKIFGTQTSLAQYDAYRAAVEARGHFVSAGRSAGNENRRWHGTRRECSLGDPGNTQFCSSATCSLCCIVRTSFDLSLFGKKTGWGRFGKGIYTSSTSSKSNDYSHNGVSSPLKAILLNKVIVGKGYKMTQDNTSLSAPPTGFDSVLAEKGGSLNYDELVVYTNDAIRPSFLVMYDA